MVRLLTVFLLSFSMASSAIAISPVKDTKQTRKTKPLPLIRDGFVLNGIDGTVTKDTDGDKWIFISDTDISDGRVVLKAGDHIELVPSNTLEVITADAQEDFSAGIKIWGRVTKYNNENFLFPWHFIPMTDIPLSKLQDQDKGLDKEQQTPQEPPKDSIIPADVMAMLKPRRVVNLAKLKKVLETEGNALLVDRTGFMVHENETKVFKLDGLGRNIDDMSFKLLPCETLQWAETNLSKSANRLRYRVAGTVTKYDGKYYILLHRAARAYSHGNFVR